MHPLAHMHAGDPARGRWAGGARVAAEPRRAAGERGDRAAAGLLDRRHGAGRPRGHRRCAAPLWGSVPGVVTPETAVLAGSPLVSPCMARLIVAAAFQCRVSRCGLVSSGALWLAVSPETAQHCKRGDAGNLQYITLPLCDVPSVRLLRGQACSSRPSRWTSVARRATLRTPSTWTSSCATPRSARSALSRAPRPAPAPGRPRRTAWGAAPSAPP